MEDKRLERIYDYTKWHLGIYLSVAGALTAALGYLAETSKSETLAKYVDNPKLLLAAVGFMFLAGLCGAIVASSCTECNSYEELWKGKHGPFGLKIMQGRYWAALEHTFFWVSAALAVGAILLTPPVLKWLKAAPSTG